MAKLLNLPFDAADEVIEKAKKIKLVIFDVDGVLTDGSLFLGDDGQEYKIFNSLDGHGIKMLLSNNVEIGIITGRTSKVVEHRVANLNIKHVFQGCIDKLPVFEKLINELGIDANQSAFVGDDVVDLPIMLRVGLSVAVSNAHNLVKKHAHWATPSQGGRGAVREICELIMYAQGSYDDEMKRYLE